LELEHYQWIALYGFTGALIFGAIVSRTQFCTMGAISDWINMGSLTRFRVWILAMAIAMVVSQAMHLAGVVNLGDSIYLSTSFTWLGYIVGGFLFGIGMTIGSGCGQRTLARIGGGNLKSLVLLLVMAITAYMTLRGLLALLRLEINDPTTVDLAERGLASQGLPDLIAGALGISPTIIAILLTAVVAIGALVFALRDSRFLTFDNLIASIGIGLLIPGAWYVTGVLGFDDFDPVPVEGVTFIGPVGNTLSYLMTFTGATISFSIAVVIGTIVGAFLYSAAARTFRLESFNDRADLVNHLWGGVLMGFGGVMALGCTIGQGITGMSTLALGSVMALLSIIAGCVFTLKMQYYLYDEQGWGHAISSTLRDLVPGAKKEGA